MQQPDWQRVARTVLLSRRLDAREVNDLTPQGRVNYQFSAMGHELAQVLLAEALNHPRDAATVYYRSRPFVLANGLTAAEALAGGMARTHSPSEGRDVGVVFSLPRRQRAAILPSSGNVGAQYTPAAGWAQSIRYRAETLGETEWQGALAVALGGDGSVAANGFWAALNIVTTLRLPYLFFIEDNRFGISVRSHLQYPGGDITANLQSYGNLHLISADGTQPAQAWQAIQQAVEHIRSGTGPALLRLSVPRLLGHTFIDTQAYKTPAEKEEETRRDPIPRLRDYLLAEGILSAEAWHALEEAADRTVDSTLQEAEAAPEPDPDTIGRHLFFEGTPPLQGGLRPEGALPPVGESAPRPEGRRINLIEAVRRTLEDEMSRNPRILVFGEDVGLKGGVHGATIGMQAHFGEARLFDTSLNEDGIIGRAAGMALAGLLPVPEIQFRKYADPAHEQISDLGTVRWRTAGKFAAPVVVRMPVGYARKTGDPWHSVSGEAVYAHLPGWRIAFPSNAEDAAGLLRTALRGDDPTLFFEHRALLDSRAARRPYPGADYCLPFGQAARLMEGSRLTLVTWGAMVYPALQAAAAHPGLVEVLDLRTICPWDAPAVLESVRKTGRLLVVHEDTRTLGFGAEIIAEVNAQAFEYLDAPPRRLSVPDHPIPYNVAAMHAILPMGARLAQAIADLLNY
ncbi:MAG: transketolase C-terminal domain-containing protein [Anaerolineales bacterium]